MNAALVDRVLLLDVFDDLPQVLDFASAGVNFAIEPPAPAVAVTQATIAGDKRVGDEEALPVRQFIEAANGLDVAVVLAAAVQHQQQRTRALAGLAARHVHHVMACARAGIVARLESVGMIVRRRRVQAFPPAYQRGP